MGVMAIPGSALSRGRSVNDIDKAPSQQVEWNTGRTQFRVQVGQV